jgi:lipid-binding SYLF domain-containing protein
MKKKRSAVLFVMLLFVALAFAQSEDQKGGSTERDRVKDSGQVLKQILGTPDEGIPNSVMDGAKCVIILPSVKKVAIGIGGSYGRGVMTCRTGADYKGPWSAPVMMASSGGSIGLQIGGEATDFVITVMNDGGARSLLSSKVKLGADASVAAGPVGRTAEAATNAKMQAQMLSYSRSQGVFGGVSLSGSTLRPDEDANEHLYGQKSHRKKSLRERYRCQRKHSS